MKKSFFFIVIPVFFVSCFNDKKQIDYSLENKTDSLTMDSIVNDTTKILVAEFPFSFDSTGVLLHPIGLIKASDASKSRTLKISSVYDGDSNDFTIAEYRGDCLSGNITNLIFEDISTGKQKLLTNKALEINNIEYLRLLAHKIKRNYIMYTVVDMDTNHDGELNQQDIESLYLSELNGNNFRKITLKNHKLNGGKLITQNLRYYFKTQEDVNKDGVFSQADQYHYNYIDFSGNDYKVVEYFPLDLINK